MGILSRMSTVFKSKMSKMVDRMEDPRETLDYSYQKQLELLQNVKRGVADVVASKKRLELQTVRLKENVSKLEQQAKEALRAGREDLARVAIERKAQAEQQLAGLASQIADLEKEQEKLIQTESRLRAKVDAFRTQKEVIRAQYSAAEAQVKIGEAATGLSEEFTDVGMALERAQEKTENMKARAMAIDELVAAGTLEDHLRIGGDDVDRELAKMQGNQRVSDELERLKREVGQS